MQNLTLKTVKLKSFALITIFVMIASIGFMATTVKAQVTMQGNPDSNITGGPLPAGVTPNATVPTVCFLSVSPMLLGVGQQLLVNIWLGPALPVNRAHTGYTVTFTKPDGTTDKIGPLDSFAGDTTNWFDYTVNEAGNWTAVFNFAGDYYPAGYYVNGLYIPNPTQSQMTDAITGKAGAIIGSAYYQPSQSPVVSFTVQQNMVASLPAVTPLPTSYWTRPISPDFRSWYTIAGSYPWDYANNYQFEGPYVTAPTSAHVLWRREGELGGIIGGDVTASVDSIQTSFYNGGGFGIDTNIPTIIFDGRCYQTITKPVLQLINGTEQLWPTSVWECYDLKTGQIYWDLTGITQVPTKIIFDPGQPEVEGAVSAWRSAAYLVYIGNNRLIKYNPFTGAVALNITTDPAITSGTLWGDQTVYTVQTITISSTVSQYNLIAWNVTGTTAGFPTFASRIISNFTIPFATISDYDFTTNVGVYTNSLATGSATGMSTGTMIEACSLATGKLLWNITTPDIMFSGGTARADQGYFGFGVEGYNRVDAWNDQTGQAAWSTPTSYPWGDFYSYQAESAYGLFYQNTYAGIYAFNWTTGAIVWYFNAPSPPFETPYNGYSFFGSAGVVVADGQLYAFNNQHTAKQPLARGWSTWDLNATTGAVVWNITGWMTLGAVADGCITAGNDYDGYMYVFGPGPSYTTVTAPMTTVSSGAGVLIQGEVMDQSPGTLPADTSTTSASGGTSTATFNSASAPSNVACVSDASMSTYMQYVYMQTPIPAGVTVTGVPVMLTAIDPTGATINIGTATSDISGKYSFAWTPPTAGQYTIVATFAGDDSYGSSSGETALLVANAPSATPTLAPTVSPLAVATTADLATYVIAAAIAIIIAIAILGVLILRKRP